MATTSDGIHSLDPNWLVFGMLFSQIWNFYYSLHILNLLSSFTSVHKVGPNIS